MRFPTLTPGRLTGLIAIAVCTAALIPAVALTATASPAAPASAARVSASAAGADAITIKSATLVANGAAIRVTFAATCIVGHNSGSVSSTTTQAAGDRVAQGATGFAPVDCTGTPQQVSVLAPANVNGAPFHAGLAVVQASLGECDPNNVCAGATANKVLSISR
jgi:hypothetical protein